MSSQGGGAPVQKYWNTILSILLRGERVREIGITMEYGNKNHTLFEIALGYIVGGRWVVVQLLSDYERF